MNQGKPDADEPEGPVTTEYGTAYVAMMNVYESSIAMMTMDCIVYEDSMIRTGKITDDKDCVLRSAPEGLFKAIDGKRVFEMAELPNQVTA